jgi:hypothetical protein
MRSVFNASEYGEASGGGEQLRTLAHFIVKVETIFAMRLGHSKRKSQMMPRFLIPKRLGKEKRLRPGATSPSCNIALADHSQSYFVTKTNPGAFGTGHLNLPIVEQIPARRLMNSQIVRLYDLNPTGDGCGTFRIDLNQRVDVHELENQVV